ncbi:MAG: transcriptional regulator [Bdellovibrionota bacterium]
MKTIPFEDYLYKKLKDPDYAIGYLGDVFEDGTCDEILLAIQDILKANGGLGRFATKLDISRPSLYKLFAENGHRNPYFRTVLNIFENIGIGFKPYLKDPKVFAEMTEESD